MLILQGTLRAAMTLPARTDKKSGEIYPARDVLQVETMDGRGLVEMATINVPNLGEYPAKVGKVVQVPVRAWAKGAAVNFMFEAPRAV